MNRPLMLIVGLFALLVASSSIFVVHEAEFAVMQRLGKIERADYAPGLHFKIPMVETVRKFDRRILTLESPPERFLTQEKKDVIVDAVVKWRIEDPARFLTAVSDELRAQQRLSTIVKDGLRAEFSKRTLKDVVAGERGNVMDTVVSNANPKTAELGVRVVDLRIKRINLPDEVSASVFQRMRAERARVANELRSEGAERAEAIRAEADRQVQVLIANADRDSQRLRGEGDATAARLYADVFGRDAQFYSFHRSLEAYRVSISGNDLMVVDPDSEFFRYFKSSQGKP